MNTLDIILLVLLLIAAVAGWRKGIIVQACGIAGLVLGILFAMRLSRTIGGWLGAGEELSPVLGFVVILVVSILVLALIGLGLHSLYIGGYLSAWFVSLVVALFALMSLSIPRKIVVKKATVEILCLLDMTEIPRMEIASVQRVDPRQMRWVVPLFGGYGFFGYYGYYFDLKTFEKAVVYASEWKNLVEIVDIYEQRYYVSCTQADELVALLQSE